MAQDWNQVQKADQTRLQKIVSILAKTTSGQKILATAKARDPKYLSRIQWGSQSVTESTLQRNLDLMSGREWLELKQEISLNRNLRLADAVLDLAHELTHFGLREPMNPYEPGFRVETFVRHEIENKGGELDAFISECRVASELRAEDKSFPVHALCAKYEHAGGEIDRELVRKDFYRVGAGARELVEEYGDKLLDLSVARVSFRSAHSGTSYPVSLVAQYEQMRGEACKNNARRLEIIQTQVSAADRGNRAPASLKETANRIADYQKRYCIVSRLSY